ncbi:hypothetical protein ES703_112539 [subsurface metagenome]
METTCFCLGIPGGKSSFKALFSTRSVTSKAISNLTSASNNAFNKSFFNSRTKEASTVPAPTSFFKAFVIEEPNLPNTKSYTNL